MKKICLFAGYNYSNIVSEYVLDYLKELSKYADILSIIAIAVLFGSLYPLTKVRKKIKGIMDKTVFSGARVMTHYNEAFSGNRVISSFNLYEQKSTNFNETLRSVFKLGMNMTKKTGILTPMMHFVISIGIAGVRR